MRQTALRPTKWKRAHRHIPAPLVEQRGHAGDHVATRKPQQLAWYPVGPGNLPVALPKRDRRGEVASSMDAQRFTGQPIKGSRPRLRHRFAQNLCRQRSVVTLFGRNVGFNRQHSPPRADRGGSVLRLKHVLWSDLQSGPGVSGEPGQRLALPQAAPVLSDFPGQALALAIIPFAVSGNHLGANRVISGSPPDASPCPTASGRKRQ